MGNEGSHHDIAHVDVNDKDDDKQLSSPHPPQDKPSNILGPIPSTTVPKAVGSRHHHLDEMHHKWVKVKQRITEADIINRLFTGRHPRRRWIVPEAEEEGEVVTTGQVIPEQCPSQQQRGSQHHFNLLSTLKKLVPHSSRRVSVQSNVSDTSGHQHEHGSHLFLSSIRKFLHMESKRDSIKSKVSHQSETSVQGDDNRHKSKNQSSTFISNLRNKMHRNRADSNVSTTSNTRPLKQNNRTRQGSNVSHGGAIAAIRRRVNLRQFLMSSRQTKQDAWEEIQQPDDDLLEESEENSTSSHEEMDHNICALCGRVTMYRVNGYPCRVCGRIFHMACLKESGRYTEFDLSLAERALTNLPGWSCEECDNLCNLLTPDEQTMIFSDFNAVDINRDASVTMAEYMAYKQQMSRKTYGRPMTAEQKAVEREQFLHLDIDGSGELEYWEFMKNEAAQTLKKRTTDDMADLLTHKEKAGARNLFQHLELLGNGLVRRDGVPHDLFRQWYCNMGKILNKTGHQENLPGQIYNASVDGRFHREIHVSYGEFLLENAIYIISSRPNKVW